MPPVQKDPTGQSACTNKALVYWETLIPDRVTSHLRRKEPLGVGYWCVRRRRWKWEARSPRTELRRVHARLGRSRRARESWRARHCSRRQGNVHASRPYDEEVASRVRGDTHRRRDSRGSSEGDGRLGASCEHVYDGIAVNEEEVA